MKHRHCALCERLVLRHLYIASINPEIFRVFNFLVYYFDLIEMPNETLLLCFMWKLGTQTSICGKVNRSTDLDLDILRVFNFQVVYFYLIEMSNVTSSLRFMWKVGTQTSVHSKLSTQQFLDSLFFWFYYFNLIETANETSPLLTP